MEKSEAIENPDGFLSHPKIQEHSELLNKIGVFSHIESLEAEITNFKNLFASALDIVNRPTISEIINAAVWHISDHFLPSSVIFIWKLLQNREDITVKCYKEHKLTDINLSIDNISIFEPFFKLNPGPVNYKIFSAAIGQNKTIESLNTMEPELVIPILGPSGLYGLVLVGRNTQGDDEYTKLELTYIQNLMSFVSKAIQNLLHYERTLRDVKTGLYNYGFFMTRLNGEIVRSKRGNTKTSIIIIDMDHFKNFNDTYGHIAGDHVLESMAITIKQGVRIGDVPSRFGGEEFVVLLPDTDKAMAWTVAERLRVMASEMEVASTSILPQVTISLGVFTFDQATNIPAEEIIKRADEALYLSKALGRNRTSVWKEGLFHKTLKSIYPSI